MKINNGRGKEQPRAEGAKKIKRGAQRTTFYRTSGARQENTVRDLHILGCSSGHFAYES